MGIKDVLIKEKLEDSGIFTFDEVYSYAYTWFKDEGFTLVEEKYQEKVTGNAREIKFEWVGTKDLSDYFKEELKVKVEVEAMTDVEVEIDGKKKKSNKGKIKFEVKGTLISDKASKWEASPFYAFWREVYNKYLISARVDALEDKVKDDVVDFKEKIKALLENSGKR